MLLVIFITSFLATAAIVVGPDVVLTLRPQNMCPKGWVPRQGSQDCYLFNTGLKKTYEEAHTECQKSSADLVVLKTSQETDWLIGQVQRLTDKPAMFVGLTKVDTAYQWLDGTPFSEDVAGWTYLDLLNNPLCVTFDVGAFGFNAGNRKVLNAVQCEDANSYMCKLNLDAGLECDIDNGWQVMNGRCVKYFEQKFIFDEAQSECAKYNANLMRVGSDEENAWLQSKGQTAKQLYLWIGYKRVDKKWTWMAPGSTTFEKWMRGQPPSSTTILNCVKMFRITGQWRADICDTRKNRLHFACETTEGNCSSGYEEKDGKCYQYNTGTGMAMTWREARTNCESQGGQLLFISKKSEQDFIQKKLKDWSKEGVERIWIGVSDFDQGGVFKWTNGQSATDSNVYQNWYKPITLPTAGLPIKPPDLGTTEPVNVAGTPHCGKMNTKGIGSSPLAVLLAGKWQTTPCTYMSHFVCQTTFAETPVTVPTPPPGPVLCHVEDGWKQMDKSCFKHMSQLGTYSKAFEDCKHVDADLASINTDDEGFLVSRSLLGDSWIGLNQRKSANNWVWTQKDGQEIQPTYLNWKVGEPPTDNNGQKNCAKMESGMATLAEWSTDECDEERHFVCKKPASSTPLMTLAPPTTTGSTPLTTLAPPTTTGSTPLTTLAPPTTTGSTPLTTLAPPTTTGSTPLTTLAPPTTTGSENHTRYCVGKPYDESQYRCCRLSIQSGGETNPNYACCFTKSYHLPTQRCCSGAVQSGSATNNKYACCGTVSYYKPTQMCCKGAVQGGNATSDDYNCCGTNSYYKPTHICCSGIVQPGGSHYYACCREKSYHTPTKSCCQGVVQNGSGAKYGCCGRKSYDKLAERCCQGQVQAGSKNDNNYECCGSNSYHKLIERCCQGQVQVGGKNNKNYACCGSNSYQKLTERCCQGEVQKGSETNENIACCGSKSYNKLSQRCCQGMVRNGGETSSNYGCCSNESYNKITERCCKGVVQGGGETSQNFACCGRNSYYTPTQACKYGKLVVPRPG